MSKPSPSLNSKRFFLSFHRHISTTSSPHTDHPALATPPKLHPPPRHRSKFPTRSASASSAPPSAPPKPLSHYDLFPATLPRGPPPHGPFVLDPRQLRQEFLQLQSHAHPDRHPGASKARAEGTSALINAAYKTLQSPLLRAQYLLSLRGIDVAGDESASVEDAELLMEVLEVREGIEAAGQEGDLEEMRRGNERRIEESEGVLEEAFGRDDVGRAKREAVRLRYWMNIKEALDAWEKGKPVVLVH